MPYEKSQTFKKENGAFGTPETTHATTKRHIQRDLNP